jgi:hypothetical protein
MVIPEDVTTLNSSDYDMMQDTCAIKSGVTGHRNYLTKDGCHLNSH